MPADRYNVRLFSPQLSVVLKSFLHALTVLTGDCSLTDVVILQLYNALTGISDIHFFLLWRCDPTRVMASSFLRFLDHTQRRTTVGRTPLDE